jgi:hypothetical protein
MGEANHRPAIQAVRSHALEDMLRLAERASGHGRKTIIPDNTPLLYALTTQVAQKLAAGKARPALREECQGRAKRLYTIGGLSWVLFGLL